MFKRVLLILSLVSLTWSLPAYAEDDKAIAGASTIGEVFGYISQYHLKETDVDQLVNSSIKGIIDQLDDPYTVYFTPGELEQFSDELNGDFEGIGVELEIRNQLPHIVRVINGTPAQQAGLQSGDTIVAVDGKEVTGQSFYDVVGQLQGKKGTKVKVTIRRAGQADSVMELTRATIDLPTVSEKILANDIGYIAIDSFGMETGEEFGNVLIKQKEAGIKSLIIDLRNNGGGFVDAAAEIASYLMGKDKTVFVTEGRDKRRDAYITEYESLIGKLPVVVLVNDQSASASEILAGALQDYGVATLLGTNTYGKGTVQDIIPLENGGALKLTTAVYLTPKGRLIDGIGLQPQRYVATPELQVYAARQLLQPGTQEIKFVGENNKVIINDETFIMKDVLPKENGKFFIPLRFTLEALGYEVKWDGEANGIHVNGKGQNWLLPLSGKSSTLNGAPKELNRNLLYKNNTSYLSAMDLRALGAEVIVQGNNLIIKM